jgi:hypothetical protein
MYYLFIALWERSSSLRSVFKLESFPLGNALHHDKDQDPERKEKSLNG